MARLDHPQPLDFLTVTETFLSGNILDAEIIPDGFQVYRRDRNRIMVGEYWWLSETPLLRCEEWTLRQTVRCYGSSYHCHRYPTS